MMVMLPAKVPWAYRKHSWLLRRLIRSQSGVVGSIAGVTAATVDGKESVVKAIDVDKAWLVLSGPGEDNNRSVNQYLVPLRSDFPV